MEASPSRIHWRPLGELLVETGLLSREELETSLSEQASTGQRLGEILVKRGLISGPALTTALMDQLGVELQRDEGFGSGLWAEIKRRHARKETAAREQVEDYAQLHGGPAPEWEQQEPAVTSGWPGEEPEGVETVEGWPVSPEPARADASYWDQQEEVVEGWQETHGDPFDPRGDDPVTPVYRPTEDRIDALADELGLSLEPEAPADQPAAGWVEEVYEEDDPVALGSSDAQAGPADAAVGDPYAHADPVEPVEHAGPAGLPGETEPAGQPDWMPDVSQWPSRQPGAGETPAAAPWDAGAFGPAGPAPDDLEDEIRRLHAILDDEREARVRAERALDDAEERLVEARALVAHVPSDVNDAVQEVMELRGQLAALKRNLDQEMSAHEAARVEADENALLLAETRSELDAARAGTAAEPVFEQAQLAELEAARIEAETACVEAETARTESELELGRVRSALQDAEAEVARLRDEIAGADARLSQERAQYESAFAELREAASAAGEREQRVVELERQVASLTERAALTAQLEAELAAVEQRVAGAESSHAAEEAAHASTRMELESARTELAGVRVRLTELDALHAELARLRSDFAQATSSLAERDARIADLAPLADTIARTERDLAAAERSVADLREESDARRAALEEEKTARSALAVRVDALETARADADARAEAERRAHAAAARRLEDERAAHDRTREALQQLTADHARLAREVDELAAAIRERDLRIGQVETELALAARPAAAPPMPAAPAHPAPAVPLPPPVDSVPAPAPAPPPAAAPAPATVPAAGATTGSHVLLVAVGGRYELVEREGAIPERGDRIDLPELGGTFTVAKLGRSPLPFDERPCIYLR